MKKVIILTLSLLAILFFYSCAKDDHHDVLKVISGYVESTKVEPMNNGATHPSVSKNNKYPTDAFMLAINVTLDSRAWGGAEWVAVDLSDPITAIRIYTVNDFNESYPAGSDVSSLFNDYPLYIFNNLKDTLEEGKNIVRMDYVNGYFYKALLTPATPGMHKFKIELELKSGDIFTGETEELELF